MRLASRLALAPLVALLLATPVRAQNELDVLGDWLAFSGAENTLYRDLAEVGIAQLTARRRTVAPLVSRADWSDRQARIRRALNEAVGPFPERTPLRARVVDTLRRDGFRLEHLIYESVPGFPVTGSLFVPEDLEEPAPAVLYLSGHTEEAYRSPTYQHVILNLVQKGFVVLAIDPIGQGERLQYPDRESGGSRVGGPTDEHSYAGAPSFLTGRSPAWIFVWDGVRAIDYLTERPEVDPDRLGVTGRSGGGTQTAYLAAFDERVRAAAPENYVTSYRRLLQSIGPQDAEQNFFQGLARGLDHADLLTVRAPRPTLVITTTRDFFSIQGARETAREVRRAYAAYGAEDRFSIVEDDAEHASTPGNRRALYAFFQRHLNQSGAPTDRDVRIIPQEELQVTETGQAVTAMDARTVAELVRRRAEDQREALGVSRADLGRHLPAAVRSARSLSGYLRPRGVGARGRSMSVGDGGLQFGESGAEVRTPGAEFGSPATGLGEPGSGFPVHGPIFTGGHQREGYRIEEYVLGGGAVRPLVPLLLFVPADPGPHPGLLYLHPDGKQEEADGEIERLVRAGYAVAAPDLPGRGETAPGDLAPDYEPPGLSLAPWLAGVVTGRSLVGVRAEAAVRAAAFLQGRRTVRDGPVAAAARGTAGPTLLHAAAFSDRIGRVAVTGSLISYGTLATHEEYDPRLLPGAVAGALTGYDLPDLAASLAPRPLLVASPVDHRGRPADEGTIAAEYEVVRRAYAGRGAEEALSVEVGGSSSPVEWLSAAE